MEHINAIFERIKYLIKCDENFEIVPALLQINKSDARHKPDKEEVFTVLTTFLDNIFIEIKELAKCIENDETVLISVKNQKLLRNCYQLIVSLGISTCLIPGLGVSLSKRSTLAALLPPMNLSDTQKYKLLVDCTEFFIGTYTIPVLKNIIINFHLSDYIAALIQLCFAPLKKPGVYLNFTMTQDMYHKLLMDRQKFTKIYELLVNNCFQPILMKELLILQNVNDCKPPAFAQKVVARELSRRLSVPGGLLSLIRCFMDNNSIDTGLDWKRIDMICKLVVQKHGTQNETEYLNNICNQLKQIFNLNNANYLTTAVACLIALSNKYPDAVAVTTLKADVFDSLNIETFSTKSSIPGTIIFTVQETDHKIQLFHSCLLYRNQEVIFKLLYPNLPVLFLLGVKCNAVEVKRKLTDILIKSIEHINRNEISCMVKTFLFGKSSLWSISVEEFNAGLLIKKVNNSETDYPMDDALFYFIDIFKESSDSTFIQSVLETSLQTLIELSMLRLKNTREILTRDNEPILLHNTDKQYVNILQLLSIICESPSITECLKKCPNIVIRFVEHFLQHDTNTECETIALVLLNTIIPNLKDAQTSSRLNSLIPTLHKISDNDMNTNSILSKEAISMIKGECFHKSQSAYEKAISNVFDTLLPSRAHGIVELTKLVDSKDTETISKRHFVFCLLQEQLKDADSYIYLATINGIASLSMHCTEDVLSVLCREYLNMSLQHSDIQTNEVENKMLELRMKIGDVIVKVTKRLGDVCIIHKTLLFNTMLCACRDSEPFIRASALSNLAEIALVLHYRIGSIICEVLLCIESIIATDKAVECRRAAVMVISSLLKGLGKETLTQLKENLLPIYQTLNKLYKDESEDNVVRLHAQIALEELNDIVRQFVFPALDMDVAFKLLNESKEVIYK